VWDRGDSSLADAVAYTLPSGLLVVAVTADQVELYRTEPAASVVEKTPLLTGLG
jgi:hypothetical protein